MSDLDDLINDDELGFDTARYSTEIEGRKVTAIVPKTNQLDDIILAFESKEDSEKIDIARLKDKFILGLAKLIVKCKYEDGENDREED